MRHLFLVGNMGAGKSTVGALLARRLGRPFFDLDLVVEQTTHKTIPQIFAEEGEARFREMEAHLLKQLAAHPTPSVIACGGGAILSEANRQVMRQHGWIVYLKASVETLLSRIPDATTRPLLQPDPAEKLQAIAAQREALYQQADWILPTDGKTPEQVVEPLARLIQPTPDAPLTIPVLEGQPHAYTVFLASGLRHALPQRLAEFGKPSQVVILSHPPLQQWAEPIASALNQQGIPTHTLYVPSGERFKTLRMVERIHREMTQRGVDRHSGLVVVGGGVLGDMGGFVAATYMRGIPFFQVPTTLLAQVDSSVGGKVGVDLPEGKNLVGAFYQPQAVFIDPEILTTLPARHWRNGFAEMLKYGIALHSGLWLRLKAMVAGGWLTPRRVRKTPDGWLLPIARCVQIKSELVSSDERDTQGLRALLNFGHTVGHAIERALNYRDWLHGEAIAAGMVAEAQIGVLMGITPEETLAELKHTLQQAGLPVALPPVAPETLLEAMRADKKRVGAQFHIVLLKAVGEAELVPNIPADAILEALRRCAPSSHSAGLA
ncbi:MAG: 3-dehydroquinate synthase [Armatimonadetes bacterium]|nr:3-dehydroquinate synthase [Armatimonadota bacterium]CUU36810.1 3-dehydroquinate synthase [Armatimonadetes bacterium DC]